MFTSYHCISTDEKRKHFLCPKGDQTWCFYQKAIAVNKKKKWRGKADERRHDTGRNWGRIRQFIIFYGRMRPTAKKIEIPSHSTMKVHLTVGTEEQKKIRDVYKTLRWRTTADMPPRKNTTSQWIPPLPHLLIVPEDQKPWDFGIALATTLVMKQHI